MICLLRLDSTQHCERAVNLLCRQLDGRSRPRAYPQPQRARTVGKRGDGERVVRKSADFVKTSWLSGPGGIGYGDDDDATVRNRLDAVVPGLAALGGSLDRPVPIDAATLSGSCVSGRVMVGGWAPSLTARRRGSP